MFIGIALHAAVAYMPTRMPDLLWPLYDPRQSWFCDIVFWWVHAFRLPVFFILAGFFSELLFQKRGADSYIRHRLKRLVIPYFVSLFTIGSLTFVVFFAGWYLTDRVELYNIRIFAYPMPEDIQDHFFGPAHLWFLADLIIMSVTYWRLRAEWPDVSDENPAPKLPLGPPLLMPVVFAFPTAMILWGDVSPFVDFHNTFIPDPSRLLYYGIYFVSGVLFYRHRDWFITSLKFPWTHLLLSIPASVLMLWAVKAVIADDLLINKLYVAVTVSLVAWLSVFGWFGVFIHYWKMDSPTVRYLSDSSYWMYLIHLPIVAALQIAMFKLPWPADLKFFLITAITTVIGLVTYHWFVRFNVIGDHLHGPRKRATVVPVSEQASTEQVIRDHDESDVESAQEISS